MDYAPAPGLTPSVPCPLTGGTHGVTSSLGPVSGRPPWGARVRFGWDVDCRQGEWALSARSGSVAVVSAVVDHGGVLDPAVSPEAGDERSRLMDAALHVMRRNGFQGASVQDILDYAGLSTRAFYRQFRSKDDLLLAMFRTASDPDVAQVVSTSGMRRRRWTPCAPGSTRW